MGLKVAFQAFIKAFKEPEKGRQFVEGRISLKQEEGADPSHLRLLHDLQQSSRLVDFLKEDIKEFTDAQVGAAVRKIHHDCAQAVEELVTIRPLREESEGSLVHIQKGYDPTEIKVVGKIKGEPPFTGILVHRGWKAQKRSLPKKTEPSRSDVIASAEVEIKQ